MAEDCERSVAEEEGIGIGLFWSSLGPRCLFGGALFDLSTDPRGEGIAMSVFASAGPSRDPGRIYDDGARSDGLWTLIGTLSSVSCLSAGLWISSETERSSVVAPSRPCA